MITAISPATISETPLSPVTGTRRVSLVDQVAVTDVIAAYRDIGVDVESMFGHLQSIQVFRCDDTGYRFYFPYELAADALFYAKLQSDDEYYASWRWEHGEAVAALADSHRILEIGSGTGNFLARLRDEFGKNVCGLELNPRALEMGLERGLSVVGQRIEEFADRRAGEFDAVCAFQVLEHMSDVGSFFRAVCAVLSPGGKLIVGVPNNNPYPYKFDRLHALNLPPHHMGLWNRSALERIGRFFPLSPIMVREEPLQDVGYFWSVYLTHLRQTRPALHYLLSKVPWRVTLLLQAAARSWAPGLNIMAVYQRGD